MVSNPYLDRPYRGAILCKDNRADCKTYTLPNGIKVVYEAPEYNYYKGKGGSFVYCSLVNPTGGTLSINRDEFVIRSAKGITYVPEPFRLENNPRAMIKKINVYPSVYPVKAGQSTVYVFSYYTDKKYPKHEMIDLFKADTIYYLHKGAVGTDTLFSVVADDHRLMAKEKK